MKQTLIFTTIHKSHPILCTGWPGVPHTTWFVLRCVSLCVIHRISLMQSAGNDFELLYIRLRCLKNTEASSFFNFFFMKPKKKPWTPFFSLLFVTFTCPLIFLSSTVISSGSRPQPQQPPDPLLPSPNPKSPVFRTGSEPALSPSVPRRSAELLAGQ